MDLILQAWGGLFYLANKICFALGEGKDTHTSKRFKIIGWSAYLVGVPAWVVLLAGQHNWIAASIEGAGIPIMLLGLYQVYTEKEAHIFFQRLVQCITYFSILLGLTGSVLHYGGIISFTQILEIAVVVGFLLGSYFLAHHNNIGWFFFMLMNLSTAILMMIEHKNILMCQQLLSLGFVIYGYLQSRKGSRNTGASTT